MNEQDDMPPPRTRCKRCQAKLRAAPDCYTWDARTRRHVLDAGVTPEEERAAGWTCGRCHTFHHIDDMRA